MAFTTPRTWVTSEIITAAIGNLHWRDNQRYLKGIGQVPTIESGLTIDNTDGDERLLLPLLSTAECANVLNAEGEVAFDEQTHRMKWYNGTAVRSDGDLAAAFIASQAQGDIIYADSATTWARLAPGTSGYYLETKGAGANPVWSASIAEYELYVPFLAATGPAVSYPINTAVFGIGYDLDAAGEHVNCSFRIPNNFTTLVSAKIKILGLAAGTFDWTLNTNWGANTEGISNDIDSVTVNGATTPNNIIGELDVSAAFTGIVANDWLTARFILDALGTTTHIYLSGLSFVYI